MPTLDTTAPLNIRNVLVATDFSSNGGVSLEYALAVARRNHAKIFISHVVTESYALHSEANQRLLDDAWREANRVVTDHFISGRLDGIDHQVVIEQGEIWDKLSGLIERLSIDFLVIGTRGRGRLGKLLLGSTAEDIFRQSACPVLTIGPRSPQQAPAEGLRKILFSTGFSAHSLRAGGYAVGLAQRLNARLNMLTVIPEPASYGDRDHLVADAQKRLRELVPANLQLTAEPEYRVEFGSSAEQILAVAEQTKPDLIVLGVRQPTGFARRFKWATAYEVVNRAPCPVLTVRSAAPEQ